MRVPSDMVEYLAKEIMKSLLEKKMIEVDSPKDDAIETVNRAIIEELRIEDRLNEEVKEILSDHEKRLDKEGVDYRKMFLMIKKKLVRERELIL